MSEEDRKLQKHLVDEMMKVSESNPDVMFYMESLMKKYEELEQKAEQLENIRKEVIGYINHEIFKRTILVGVGTKKYTRNILDNILNILNKGSEKE